MAAFLIRLILGLSALMAPALAVAAGPLHIAASLHAATQQPSPGQTILLALRMSPERGWHGYWSNPGDSGLPPEIKWTVPRGVTIGPLMHPAPQVLRVAGMISFVHAGEHVLLAQMRLPRTVHTGDALPIDAALKFLACSDSLCVPQAATLHLDLVVGNGELAAGERSLFAAASRALPINSTSAGQFFVQGKDLTLIVPSGLKLSSTTTSFFPSTQGVFDRNTVTTLQDGRLQLGGRMTVADGAILKGVVSDGRRAYDVRFRRSVDLPSPLAAQPEPAIVSPQQELRAKFTRDGTGPAVAASSHAASARQEAGQGAKPAVDQAVQPKSDQSLGWAMVGALLGGLLLNLMPCVFPILSLKAMQLARASHSVVTARRDSVAYAAGTLLSCLALGLVMYALRSAGTVVGWSFQLQSPLFILAMLLLVTGISLNFTGLFHVVLPTGIAQSGKFGRAGAFGSGVLAAAMATPCSAPFMATAVGAAMLFPGWSGLLIFAALGLGLGLPFLVIGLSVSVRARLPKPGAWMERLQRLLSVPMFITALGLAWILGRQAGSDGMALGLGAALVLALALWWVGSRQHAGVAHAWLPIAPAILLALPSALLIHQAHSIATPDQARMTEPFSEDRLAELRARGTPVFVDFTADWCLTCKVNERLVVDRPATRAAFARAGIVTLVGDWTNGDPAITRFLASHRRNSIPLYLYYAPRTEGRILPQFLTPAVIDNLAGHRS